MSDFDLTDDEPTVVDLEPVKLDPRAIYTVEVGDKESRPYTMLRLATASFTDAITCANEAVLAAWTPDTVHVAQWVNGRTSHTWQWLACEAERGFAYRKVGP